MNLKSGRVPGGERDECGRMQDLFLIHQKVPLPTVFPSTERVPSKRIFFSQFCTRIISDPPQYYVYSQTIANNIIQLI
jgi:hypothetical protein